MGIKTEHPLYDGHPWSLQGPWIEFCSFLPPLCSFLLSFCFGVFIPSGLCKMIVGLGFILQVLCLCPKADAVRDVLCKKNEVIYKNNPFFSFSQASQIVYCCPVLGISSLAFPLHTPCILTAQSPAASLPFPQSPSNNLTLSCHQETAVVLVNLSQIHFPRVGSLLWFSQIHNSTELGLPLESAPPNFPVPHWDFYLSLCSYPFVHLPSICTDLHERQTFSEFLPITCHLPGKPQLCLHPELLPVLLSHHPFPYPVYFVGIFPFSTWIFFPFSTLIFCPFLLWFFPFLFWFFPFLFSFLCHGGAWGMVKNLTPTGEGEMCGGERNSSWIKDALREQEHPRFLSAAEKNQILCYEKLWRSLDSRITIISLLNSVTFRGSE